MRALVLHEANGPGSAQLEDVDDRTPGPGEVRVALRAASLNHRELWISRGLYPGMRLPAILGADGAGLIDLVGEGVDPARLGAEVVLYPAAGWGDNPAFPSPEFGLLGMPHDGTVAQHIVIPAAHALTKPEGLSFVEAAALPVAGLTAWRALTVKANVQPGEKVLVTGIGGGVAGFALLFARALGAEVFVTSGSDHAIAAAATAGAAAAFDYREEGWGKALAKRSGGIDVVVDGAPASSVPAYGRALAPGARVVIYGSTGGSAMTIAAPDLFLKHASVLGTAMGTLPDFKAMLAFIEQKQLHPFIDREFELERAAEALAYLEKGHGFGKVCITIA